MSAESVTAELERYVSLLRQVGMRDVDNLRPAVSPERLHQIEQQFGVTLPEDARAVWMWHDGLEAGNVERPFYFGPRQIFAPLDQSLRWAADFVGAVTGAWDESPWAHRQFVALQAHQHGRFVDITPGRETLTYYSEPSSVEIDAGTPLTVTDTISWWCWMVEHEAWVMRPDGIMIEVFENFPPNLPDLAL